ncbi:MAG: DUF3187 family protein [Thermodesulfobacteriota bacterium]
MGAATFLLLAAVPAAASEFAPLPVRNLYPPRLLFLQPSPSLPEQRSGGRMDLAYATVCAVHERGDTSLVTDMEVGRVAAVGRWGAPWGGGFSLEVPYLWYGGGAFDPVLDAYHDAFGFPDGDREDRPENAFGYRVTRGRHEYAPRSPAGGGLGDMVLEAVHPLGAPGPLRSAARLSLKLPTGSARNGFGSGHADGGGGVLASWQGPRAGVGANVDVLYLGGSPDAALRLESHWALSALAFAGVQLGPLGTAAAQLHFATSPYGTGLPALDRDVLLLALGVRRQVGADAWISLGFTEDLVVQASPDFSLFVGVEW